jgi:hypothetical protein
VTAADPVRAIADAVLYEGYILWPYRRSALKNQRRFTFGGVFPPAHAALHPDDPDTMRAEVLVRGDGVVKVTVRFLQIVRRTVLGADGRPADERVVDGERYLSWEEAAEREIAAPGRFAVPSGVDCERGFLERTWERLDGAVDVAEEPTSRSGVRRLSATVRNLSAFEIGGSRHDAMKRTFCSTHMLLRSERPAAFVSLTDPPEELAAEAAACQNAGCWPVLVGGEPAGGDSPYSSTMLASPIILEDHPRIAPESPGDMFDGGEIDQLLVLNILALTDEEQAEMAASDTRANEILERVRALTPEQLMALHGRTSIR